MIKKRIVELDMVKGIGIIYVFLRHLCELTGVNTYGGGVYFLFDSCTECMMFLFVFLSGYVYKPKPSIGEDIKNKVRQLLIPYVKYISFFSCIYFFVYVLQGDMSLAMFGTYTISNFLGNPGFDYLQWTTYVNPIKYAFVPFWYIAEIFSAFTLFILVFRMVKDKGLQGKGIAAIMLLVLTSLLMYFDLRGIIANTFVSGVSYFTVCPNITGFAALLLIGHILHEVRAFDLEFYSKKNVMITLAISLFIMIAFFAFHDNPYALQYAHWGSFGIRSVYMATVSALALTYMLINICYYLKHLERIRTCLTYIGANTLDILLLHFGIGELITMAFGFWYPVYDIPCYPADGFAWWHFHLVVVLTAIIIGIYFAIKKRKEYVWK